MACDVWPMTCWTPPEDEDLANLLWGAACDAVWALTGRRVGVCTFDAYYGVQPQPVTIAVMAVESRTSFR